LIELDSIAELGREVFGPILHVVRYRREELDPLIEQINATGYGLTFGIHTRIDETIAQAVDQVQAGNLYVNRNMIGAVVGVQPYGGVGLPGAGPKPGVPLYRLRLLPGRPEVAVKPAFARLDEERPADAALREQLDSRLGRPLAALRDWAREQER